MDKITVKRIKDVIVISYGTEADIDCTLKYKLKDGNYVYIILKGSYKLESYINEINYLLRDAIDNGDTIDKIYIDLKNFFEK